MNAFEKLWLGSAMDGDAWPTIEELQAAGVLLVEDGNHGENRPRRGEFITGGTAFIRAADMSDGRVNFVNCERINNVALARIRKGIGQPKDILLSHKGTVGKLALVPDDAPPFVCSPQTTFWRVLDDQRLDRGYLYAFMRSRLFGAQLAAVQGETDMAPYVSLTAQRKLRIAVPRITQQIAVGGLLGVLDKKIELNQCLADTLREMARALFKSWFVDFDPVHAKVQGRATGLSDDLAALFPGGFGEDGLPAGWELRPISDLFEIRGGNTPRTENTKFWDGDHNWATPKDLSTLAVPVLLRTGRSLTDLGLQQVSSGLLPIGSLLLSTRAPIGYMAIAAVPTAINQGFAGFARLKTSPAYAWAWCDANIDTIIGNAGGSTFPEISKAVLRQLPMLAPPQAVLDAFGTIIDSLMDRITTAARESQVLAGLRDTLLPRLVSGELQIAGVEKQVAVA
jgi:type I restriction enzyme S subunit